MIRALKKEIDRELHSFHEEMERDLGLREISPLLSCGIKDFIERDGKRIRPVLCVLSYFGYVKTRKASRKNIIRTALSLELLHDFLLIHDDIIDKSDMRRGRPSLHKFFDHKIKKNTKDSIGPELGIVAGDVIFALALRSFMSFAGDSSLKEKAFGEFIRTVVFTGAGEFIDITSGAKDIEKVRRKEILGIYTLKTAEYTFSGPLKIGALLAGVSPRETDKLARLGSILGSAFQLLDDLLDVFSTTGNTGKPVMSDLLESKKTLLVLETLKRLKGTQRDKFRKLFEKKTISMKDARKLKEMIILSSAHMYCLSEIRKQLKRSSELLNDLGMKKEYKKELLKLIKDIELKAGSLPLE